MNSWIPLADIQSGGNNGTRRGGTYVLKALHEIGAKAMKLHNCMKEISIKGRTRSSIKDSIQQIGGYVK